MNEVKESRYAGPFTKENFQLTSYIQSPIGLVPKADDKTRLIFHLSFDFGQLEEIDKRSVNFHIPQEICRVKYRDLDSAIKDCLELLKQSGLNKYLYFGKTDCSHAFRVLLAKISQCFCLVMKIRHPETLEWCWFIDKCLPFRANISCARYQKFSDSLRHIADWKIYTVLMIRPSITNYLDDFLFAALTAWLCDRMMKIFLDICEEIRCPISKEKTVWSTQLIVFLGVLLNGLLSIISLPQEKKLKVVTLLRTAIQNKKVTIKFVQQLMRMLNFLNKAIVPGRAFTWGMYQKIKT